MRRFSQFDEDDLHLIDRALWLLDIDDLDLGGYTNQSISYRKYRAERLKKKLRNEICAIKTESKRNQRRRP